MAQAKDATKPARLVEPGISAVYLCSTKNTVHCHQHTRSLINIIITVVFFVSTQIT